MVKNKEFAYHEIDFLLPIHRFKIQFSYVSKKGLPFIREYILRLVHLDSMSPKQIGKYFGLSSRETKEAISNLVDIGDLSYTDEGLIKLTSQASAYFTGLGDLPSVSTLFERKSTLGFELANFNCVGSKRTFEKRKNALVIDASDEQKSKSESLVKKHFQTQFYSILEKGFLGKLEVDDDPDSKTSPSIYKIDLAEKVGQEHFRLSQIMTVDELGNQLGRSEINELAETSEIVELITQSIHEQQKAKNISEVLSAMELIGDKETQTLFINRKIDVISLTQMALVNENNKSGFYPFLGSIYSKNNWELFLKYFNEIIAPMQKAHQDGVDDLIWIAPSDNFWGKSTRLAQCLGELVSSSTVSVKNKKTLYKPKMYVPLSDESDRRSKSQWKNEFSDYGHYLHGLAEGFLDGNVEVIVLPNKFAAVCYHMSMPEQYDVTLPLGFVTTDNEMISRITKLAEDYIGDVQGFDKPNNLGLINK
jgi:hypothetical protein